MSDPSSLTSHLPAPSHFAEVAVAPQHTPHTPVPNYLLDTLLPTLNGTELKVLLVVVRQTWGWHQAGRRKTRDWLTQSQLKTRTGHGSEAISHAIDSLVRRGLMQVEDQARNPLVTPAQRRRHCGKLYYRLGVHALGLAHAPGENGAEIEQRDLESEVRKANTTKETNTKYLSKDRVQPDGYPCGKLAAATKNPGMAQGRNPQVRQFLYLYRELFQRHSALGEAPPIAWGRDGKIVGELLKLYAYERLSDLLEQFFDNADAWLRKRGYSLAAFRDALPSLLLAKAEHIPCRSATRSGQWTTVGQVKPSERGGRNAHQPL